jgi:hypothetical protein
MNKFKAKSIKRALQVAAHKAPTGQHKLFVRKSLSLIRYEELGVRKPRFHGAAFIFRRMEKS